MCCDVLQCVAVCCDVLQCVTRTRALTFVKILQLLPVKVRHVDSRVKNVKKLRAKSADLERVFFDITQKSSKRVLKGSIGAPIPPKPHMRFRPLTAPLEGDEVISPESGVCVYVCLCVCVCDFGCMFLCGCAPVRVCMCHVSFE